jgi:hypothetical protein
VLGSTASKCSAVHVRDMGVHEGGAGDANDDPFEQYRKRMMLGYK